MNAPELTTLRMARHIRAPREKVFDAFVLEALVQAWQCPRGMKVTTAQVDARPDGAWRVEMLARDGTRFIVGGRYREVARPHRLVYSWHWEGDRNPMPQIETLIEVTLTERDGGTDMTMVHSGFPAAAARDGHAQGWGSCFNRLNDLLDPQGSAGTITLLGDARSTYTRTARMALAEKGIAYSMSICGPRTPDIMAVHPFGRIPALRDGEIKLWETSAILRYLDECFDTGVSLTPGSIMERARCEQWVSAVNAYLYDTLVRRYVLQYIFPRGADGKPDRTVIDAAVAEMPAQFDALEQAYGNNNFLAGNSLSFADLFLAPILAYVQRMPEGGQLLASRPNILRAQALMRARPSFVNTDPSTTP